MRCSQVRHRSRDRRRRRDLQALLRARTVPARDARQRSAVAGRRGRQSPGHDSRRPLSDGAGIRRCARVAESRSRSGTASLHLRGRGRTRLRRGLRPPLGPWPAANATRGASTAGSAAVKSIAVMPFVNIGGDTAAEYFADGMTEEIISALAKTGGLLVAARSSVFALKGKQLDVRTVGDTLGVGTVLEGSVRRAGNRLRVTAQLVNTADGYHLWSDEYDRELSDVFQVQDEIARAIAGAMRVRFSGATDSRGEPKPPTADPAAHELYLKGRFFINMRGSVGGLRAVEYFQQAARRDSTYALAYAGLAEAHTRLGMLGLAPPQKELPKAKAFARKALALDSTLAVAHTALAHILFVHDWDREAAEREFQRAIALDPHDANTRWLHAISLLAASVSTMRRRSFLWRASLTIVAAHELLLGRFYVARHQHRSSDPFSARGEETRTDARSRLPAAGACVLAEGDA